MKPERLKISFITLITLLTASLAIIFAFQPKTSMKKIHRKNSPEALHQAELERKIERRSTGYAKQDQPDRFTQVHRDIRTREGETGPRYKPNYKIEAMKSAGILNRDGRYLSQARMKNNSAITWIERGPANFSGRARGLVIDPTDTTGSTWFVGSVGGGVWKTTDAGATFIDKTPYLPALATTVVDIAQSNPDVLYVGTGEGFGNIDGIQGDGIFKSTDHGETWNQLSSTAANEDFFYVNRLVINPANENIVVTATNTGVFKSTNGGVSWSKTYTTNSRVQQIIANSASFDTLYGTVNGLGVIRSVNAGDSWTIVSGTTIQGSRIEIAIAPTNRGRLYAAVENGNASDFYTSGNAGGSWVKVNENVGAAPSWLGGQGWYDNTIAVHPYDENIVFVGGVNLWKITVASGKRTTVQQTNWYPGLTRPSGGVYPWIHADQHNIVMIPKGNNVFHIVTCNDGGVALSTNGGVTWLFDESTPGGMNTTQFYGVDKKPGANAFIGGTQDNGTWRSPLNAYSDSAWHEQLGGDGFDAVWNHGDGNQLIGSIYDNSIYKSTDGGATWNPAMNGLLDVDNENSYFITQIASSKLDPNLIFAIGGSGVWRSDNFGDNWTLAPLEPANFGFSTGINYVAISEANPQIVWAGTRMSASGKLNVSSDGGLTFSPTINYNGVTLGAISGIATHPTEANTAYAMFSFAGAPKILRTTNLGQSWTDISGFNGNSTSNNGFPDVATYCLQVMPNNPNEIWAGTDIGLFISTDNGISWAYSNNGLPAVAIWEMKIVDDQVVLATHGRGVWTTQISVPPAPQVTLSPRLKAVAQNPSTGDVVVQMDLRSLYDSTFVTLNNAKIFSLGASAPKDTTINLSLAAGNISLQIASYKNGIVYKSSISTINVVPASDPVTQYSNNFNSPTTDFSGTLFTVSTPSFFTSGALHSLHPYQDNTNHTFQLNIPITVTPDSCKLSFDEIVLVEEGDPGTVFGDPSFWDYVIVEGSSDGVNWEKLSDGWDARLYDHWLTAYRNSTAPNAGFFRKHIIEVRNTFSSGTTIFIRFRLFADGAVTGWGWAIDNVAINADLVAPTLTLGALASPVVNTVRFVVGANEKLGTASVFVNTAPLTMIKQGDLFFGNYTISGPGTLSVYAEGADSNNNPGNVVNQNYTISPLGKGMTFENYALSAKGNGYWVLGKLPLLNIPSFWKVIGSPIDVAATGSASDFTAEFNYSHVEALGTEYADFNENKIGIYENINGEWKHAGGEGENGSVTAKFKGNQLAVFYNPDYEYIPKEFMLSQNYPNPFNPSTTIRYEVPKSSKVVIKVYNMLGQEVRTLVNGNRDRGRHEIAWDGKNQFGNQVSSGVYLYRLEAGNVVKTKKMLFIK